MEEPVGFQCFVSWEGFKLRSLDACANDIDRYRGRACIVFNRPRRCSSGFPSFHFKTVTSSRLTTLTPTSYYHFSLFVPVFRCDRKKNPPWKKFASSAPPRRGCGSRKPP